MSEALRLAVEEMFSRGWHELLSRDSGTLHVRLIFQPYRESAESDADHLLPHQ
jgi:hypothetical protein